MSERANAYHPQTSRKDESIDNSLYEKPLRCDKEARSILKRISCEAVPEPRFIVRLANLIEQCKGAAFEVYQLLMETHWKVYLKWLSHCEGPEKSEERKLLISLLEKLICIGNRDFRRESTKENGKKSQIGAPRMQQRNCNSFVSQSIENQKVLQNITNTYKNAPTPKQRLMNPKLQKAGSYSKERPTQNNSFCLECCANPTHSTQLFQKCDLQNLVHSKQLVECIALFVRQFNSPASSLQLTAEKKAIQSLIGTTIEIVLDFKDREIYDTLSLWFIRADIFSPLIKAIVSLPLEMGEYRLVARVFELCACHSEGISILQRHLRAVVEMVDVFMSGPTDLIQVKYPAATVLLDLTASENCIEQVAQLIKEKDLFRVIIKELEDALKRKVPRNSPNKVYLNRYRDLMIGIILNLTCNVENEEITEHMVSRDVIRLLREILVDQRHDWPTNGAALALLQYSHIALSNSDMFIKLEDAQIYDTMMRFVSECNNVDTKKHLYEAITLISMSRSKMDSIGKIITQHCYAAAA